MSMCAMNGAANAKPGSRQARAAVSAPAEREPGDAHRGRRLGSQPGQQRARVENRLSQRLEAAHDVRRPVELAVEARRPAACAGRDREAGAGSTSMSRERAMVVSRASSSIDGLRLHVAVDVEQPRPTVGARRPDAARRHVVDAAPARRVVAPELRLDGLVLRAEAKVLALHPGHAPAARTLHLRHARAAREQDLARRGPRRRRAGRECCGASVGGRWASLARAPVMRSGWGRPTMAGNDRGAGRLRDTHRRPPAMRVQDSSSTGSPCRLQKRSCSSDRERDLAWRATTRTHPSASRWS